MKFPSIVSTSFLIVVMTVGSASIAFAGESVCNSPADLAAQMALPSSTSTMLEHGENYRVIATRWDPVLNQRWAVISSCDHPEHPSISFAISKPDRETISSQFRATSLLPFPVVHAGDLVQLWGQDQNLHVEIAGRAEQNGAVGNRIRVRLLRSGFDTGREQTMLGVVRGPRNVELVP
ncbi:flagella basal body P-ring formation protein FlgA [Edaphobacter albus]|uniref:flagella basal body P-ring formation protein FlgA n=1 Tax=Edaphobacter sp. 4G125 TaxID=2763071 RepID=UPI001647221A|nr:flagella basal body P-ring formation protein FlgA [Edaphobacter sp. 4G125]QNI35435.1 flagella basal body P-ring formation protein FlgA [Edaphobacter sp. 4G125]